jgi:hypothetical protein
MGHVYSSKDLEWRGNDICLGRRIVASVDRSGPGYRVRMPDGRLSDWANIHQDQGCDLFLGR